jgi:cytochrome c1
MSSKALYFSLPVAILFFLAACTSNVNGVPQPRPASETSIENGRRLIALYGCGSCHTIPGVPGAAGKAAPPLANFYERSFIAGHLANTSDNLVQWILDPQKIEPGTAMPNLGVKPDEARDIASFLYHQPSLIELLMSR